MENMRTPEQEKSTNSTLEKPHRDGGLQPNIQLMLAEVLEANPQNIDLFIFEHVETKKDFEEVFDFIIKNIEEKKYQQYLGKALDSIGQNGHMISPTIWFAGMSEIFSASCAADIKEHALSASNYLLSFFPIFGETLIDSVSLENTADYSKTGKYIKFIFYLTKYSKSWAFSEHLIEELKEKLLLLSRNDPEHNYLLAEFSKGALDGINGVSRKRASKFPFFKVNSPQQYGAVFEDGFLHVSAEADFAVIEDKKNTMNELESSIGTVDIRLLQQQYMKLNEEIEDIIFKKVLGPEDTILIKNNTTENIVPLYKDYLFLLDGIMRPIIEEEFGTDIFTMPVREQIHFLTYIKELKNKEVEPVKLFSKKYGIEGFRTFLSTIHGGKEMGKVILELGADAKIPHEEIKKVFEGYSKLIDAAGTLEQKLEAPFTSDENKAFHQVPQQIRDALMLRAKDILIGAHKVAEQEGAEQLNIEDVLAALQGITLMLDMITNLDTQKFNLEQHIQKQENLFKYSVTDKDGYVYGLKIFIRPKAEPKAQARINFELSFDSTNPNPVLQKAFHNEVISHTQGKTTASSVLRIGIDREDHGGEEKVSLDIGRNEHSDEALTRSGDVLGNLLSLVSTEGHHTTSPFDPELATAANFETLALTLREYLVDQGRAK